MIAGLRKAKNGMVATMVMTVISLACSAGAVSIPSISTLRPLEKGLQTPLRMVLDQNGDIYVADPRSGGVVVLDQYGTVKQTVPAGGSVGAVALLNPLVSNIPGGKLLVAQGDQVVVYNQAGVEVAKLGTGIGQFKRVAGIAVDASGAIYVTDAGSYNVKKFDTAGNFISSFGVYGAAPTTGVFMQPSAIAVVTVAGVQQLAVADTVNGNVQFFTPEGAYLKTVGTSGSVGPLLFSYPVGVAFDANRMYVLDSYQGTIQAVDLSVDPPSFLTNIGSYGFAAGQLLTPSDLVYDQTNRRLLVSNGMSNLVSFGVDGGSNPSNATAPQLSLSQSALAVAVPSATISGTVDAGATLAATVTTAAQASAAAFSSPSVWSISVSGLVAGLNTVSVTAKNQYDVTTTKTVSITYTPAAVQLSVGAFPALTGQAVLTLSGTTEAGSAVTVYNAATTVTGQARVVGTAWVYDAALAEGANALAITSAKSGSSSARRDITVARDTAAPVISASLLADGSTAANQILSVSGTVSDQNPAGFTVNGTPVAVTNGQFNTAVTLNLGANIITLNAVDQLGNASADVRTISYAAGLPVIAVQTPVDGSYTNVQDVTVAAQVSGAAVVTINGQTAVPGAGVGEYTASVKLAAGMNTIVIAATDASNKTVQEKRTVVYDGTAPTVAITTPAFDSATRLPGVTFSGTVSDNSAIKSIRATINGVDAPLTLAGTQFSVFAEFTQQTTYSVVVTITDNANNSATAQRTVLYDTTAPLLTVAPVTVAVPQSLNGTVETGSTVVVADANGAAAVVVVNGTQWSADLSNAALDTATLTVAATDAAGNVSLQAVNAPVPDGDVDGDGKVTIRDALKIIKLVVSNGQPTVHDLAHGDLGPLLNGKRNPSGKLEIIDGILILRKALGLSAWL